MFDYIECEYELPLPKFTEDEVEDLKGVDWEEVEWQTKDFHNAMIKYTISEDGQLYENKVSRFWEEDEGSPTGAKVSEVEDGIERIDHTGEIVFYGITLGKKWDHWLEFKALYWKGDLKELDCSEYKKEDNSERLKAQDQFDKALKKFGKREKSWWFPAYKIYRLILISFLGAIRWCNGLVAKITWKIEKWLP